ncbi:hypothetical protein EPI10_023391 [Gossypium australe]|uniref:Uncharacterized protein n=1 Tax=Gossypium australe TaxID=47621 RepID=A0A5B6VVG3_9ROSI|nr:hypothetical protein EPI10_023391 [Gossypium australe]
MRNVLLISTLKQCTLFLVKLTNKSLRGSQSELLRRKLETFYRLHMKEPTAFSLGEEYSNIKLVKKVMRSLPKNFLSKSQPIRRLKILKA